MNKNWEGKSSGNVLGYRIFIFLLKKIGVSAAYFLLRFVSLWFAVFAVKGAKAQYSFLRNRMKFSFLKAFFGVYKNHFIFGQILLDKIAILSGLKSKYTFSHTNADVIKNMLKNNTGGIIVNAHIGSWETAGQLLEMHGDKIFVLMLDAEHEKIKKYIADQTGKNKIEIISIKTDGSHLLKIDQVLKNKGIIAMHGDRFMDEANFLEINFFGQKAKFPTGPFKLAAKYNVPFTFATSFKEKNRHYTFIASEQKYVEYPGNITLRNKAVADAAKYYVSELEKYLLKYPFQWFNYYNFWN